MQFNKTFPQRPNDESDSAWASLFPEKLGFVQHPELAPNVAGIAVFHELHCLVSDERLYMLRANPSIEHASTSLLGFGGWTVGGDER
jgi:hypothetical protein